MLVQKNTIDKEYKMTESTDIKDMYKDTYCYTYEVTMVIQILAPTREVANAKLDQDGGYISKRTVEFKNSTLLHKDGLDTEETLVLNEEKDI
jgi:hypothetical protein